MIQEVSILAALGLQLSAIVMPNWGNVDDGKINDGVDSRIGLWQLCRTMSRMDTKIDACIRLPAQLNNVDSFPKSSLHVIRAFSILSAVFLICALFCVVNLKENGKKYLIISLFLSALCSIVAMVLWLVKFKSIEVDNKKFNVKPSYCFYFNIISAILALGLAASFYRQ